MTTTPPSSGPAMGPTPIPAGGSLWVYLAARYSRRLELCDYRAQLIARGHVCTSRWLDGEGMDLATNAKIDFIDIMQSNVVIAFSESPRKYALRPWATRGGRHVETGMSIAFGNETIVVGPRENIFHYMHGVRVVKDFAAALDELETIPAPPRWGDV